VGSRRCHNGFPFLPWVDLFFVLYATRRFDSNTDLHPGIHPKEQKRNFRFPDCKKIRFPGKVPERPFKPDGRLNTIREETVSYHLNP
jgi:hypothetical protein